MLESDSEDIINSLLEGLNQVKRKTKGQDKSKNYHKLTISINQKDKQSIQEYAESNGMSVSALIKSILKKEGII